MPRATPRPVEAPPGRPLALPVIARLIDLTFAALVLAVVWPVMLVVVLSIRRASPGPAFYTQRREGLHGRPFRIWKIRTMHLDAAERLQARLSRETAARDEWEATFCLRDDPRVAGPAARIARAYSLDELPQFWNVLVGDMTLVGPRPLEPALAAKLFEPETRRRRLSVKPGLTGLWQVSRESKREVTTTMGEYDLRYIASKTIRLDLSILLRTPAAVLTGAG